MTTLKCGHDSSATIFSRRSKGRCGVCDGMPHSVGWQASIQCGLPMTAMDDLHTAEHNAFQAAIVADPNPTGLDPRLVYAEYLDEAVDPRGELIRVECEMAEIKRLADETPSGLYEGEEAMRRATDALRKLATQQRRLAARRTALRLSLGYDKPADEVCPLCKGDARIRSRVPGKTEPGMIACPRCGGTGRVTT